jgi:hypothetical protein
MSNLNPAPIELASPRIDALMAALNARCDSDLLARLGFSAEEVPAVEAIARSLRTTPALVVRGIVAASLAVLEGRRE